MESESVTMQGFDLGVMADATAVGATLTGALLHLFQNDVVPTREFTLGDLVEADYTGYATEAVVWNAPSISDDGFPELVGVAGEFRPTSSVVENDTYGWYLTEAGGALLAAGRFDAAPVGMRGVLDALVITPRVRLTPTGTYIIVT